MTERVAESEVIEQTEDARRFNAVMGKGMVQREYQKFAEHAVSLKIPSGGKVLDIGTGTGFVAIKVAKLLAGQNITVTGVDLSDAMLSVAAENAQQAGLNGSLIWRTGDAKALPFDDNEFDLVISSGSLHHWSEPLAVFNEVARVLKPNGQCLIRDSKRLQKWNETFLAWLIGLTIPGDFRRHYWGSIHSSYTVAELQTILGQSYLQKAKIVEDIMDLMVIKEGRAS